MIHGPHKCEGLYTSPSAWPLVPDFPPRYAGLENRVTARTWSNWADVFVTSRWSRERVSCGHLSSWFLVAPTTLMSDMPRICLSVILGQTDLDG